MYYAWLPIASGRLAMEAKLLQYNHRDEEAIDAYQKALTLCPEDGLSRLELAVLFYNRDTGTYQRLQSSLPDRDLEVFFSDAAPRDLSAQLPNVLKAVHLLEDNETRLQSKNLYHRLGFGYMYLGWYDKAYKAYSKIKAYDPEFEDIDAKLAEAAWLTGLEQYRKGTEKQAEALWEKGIHHDPKQAECYAALGYHYWTSERFEEGMKFAKMALVRDPLNILAHFTIAEIKEDSSSSHVVHSHYQVCLALVKPQNRDFLERLTRAANKLSRHHPSSTAGWMVAQANMKRSDYDMEEHILDHLLDDEQTAHLGIYLEGKKLERKGQLIDAISYYQQALEQAPGFRQCLIDFAALTSTQSSLQERRDLVAETEKIRPTFPRQVRVFLPDE